MSSNAKLTEPDWPRSITSRPSTHHPTLWTERNGPAASIYLAETRPQFWVQNFPWLSPDLELVLQFLKAILHIRSTFQGTKYQVLSILAKSGWFPFENESRDETDRIAPVYVIQGFFDETKLPGSIQLHIWALDSHRPTRCADTSKAI